MEVRVVQKSEPTSLPWTRLGQVGIHVWPDNWKMKTPDFLREFTRGHIEVYCLARARDAVRGIVVSK